MFKRIDHVEIIPQDLEKTVVFHTDILGFKIRQRRKVEVSPLEEIVYLELNNTVIELLKVKIPAPAPMGTWQILLY